MAAATRYRKFLKLLEAWPVDETKTTRDLGTHLRERVAVAFKQGEATLDIDGAKCDRMYTSLQRINSNQYKNTYPRQNNNACSGLRLDELKVINTTESIKSLQEDRSLIRRLYFKYIK